MKTNILLFLIIVVFFMNFYIYLEAFAATATEYDFTISASEYSAAVIKENGDAYLWGDSKSLNKTFSDENYKKYVINEPQKIMEDIRSVSIELNYNLLIDNNNVLWLYFIDGRKEKIMEDVAMVSESHRTYYILKLDGSLWIWGWFFVGYISTEHEYEAVNFDPEYPYKIMDNVKFASIYGGIVTEDGSLWDLVSPSEVALDNEKLKYYKIHKDQCPLIPVKVLDNVKYANGSYIITTENTLMKREIDGNGYDDNYYKVMDDVSFFSSMLGCNAAIKTNGELWTWGRNDYGQLGIGSISEDQDEPRKVMDNVVLTACSTTCILALKSDGTLWKMGNSPDLNLNKEVFDKIEDYYKPHLIMRDIKIPQIKYNYEEENSNYEILNETDKSKKNVLLWVGIFVCFLFVFTSVKLYSKNN